MIYTLNKTQIIFDLNVSSLSWILTAYQEMLNYKTPPSSKPCMNPDF